MKPIPPARPTPPTAVVEEELPPHLAGAKAVSPLEDDTADLADLEAELRAKRENEPEPTPDEAAQLSEEARVAQVLSRGIMNERLSIPDLQDGMYRQWVRNTPEDIARYEALGFKLESKESFEKLTREKGLRVGLHGTADGTIRVGDVVMMVTTQDNYRLIRRVKEERARRRRTASRKDFHDQNARNREERSGRAIPIQTFEEIGRSNQLAGR